MSRPDRASELLTVPVLLDRLGSDGGPKGAIVSIDAIACDGTIAEAVRDVGADGLPVVEADQPTFRGEIEAPFADPETHQRRWEDRDKGHGRIEPRRVSVAHEVARLDGMRRVPGELRWPHVEGVIGVEGRTELEGRCRFDGRHYVPSASHTASKAAEAVRARWAVENALRWVLDVIFEEDQSRISKGLEARTMAVVRHLGIALVRQAVTLPSGDTALPWPQRFSATRNRQPQACGVRGPDGT